MSTPGRLQRVREGLRRTARSDELGHLEDTVDSLEVAVAENRGLEIPLAVLVDGLEREVAEVLSRRSGTGMGA